jgi:hypothetical protein
MSVANDHRRQEKLNTLQDMVTDLGDQYLMQQSVTPADVGFTHVLQTTWRELLDDGLIDDKGTVMNEVRFRLTARGWLRGLVVSGAVDARDFRERCTTLVRTLKALVKGRQSHHDVFADLDEVAAKAGLPVGWVSNALDARLLGVVFPGNRWDAYVDTRHRSTVRISPTFGLNHLDDNE